jgi:hypothetical protein
VELEFNKIITGYFCSSSFTESLDYLRNEVEAIAKVFGTPLIFHSFHSKQKREKKILILILPDFTDFPKPTQKCSLF